MQGYSGKLSGMLWKTAFPCYHLRWFLFDALQLSLPQLQSSIRNAVNCCTKMTHNKSKSPPTKLISQVGALWYHTKSLRWRHNGRDSVSNHQPHDCLLKLLFRRRSKKTSKLRVTGLCAWNLPGTGEFPAQMASNAENFSIWWSHHVAKEP